MQFSSQISNIIEKDNQNCIQKQKKNKPENLFIIYENKSRK